jgi:hypothetical protein
MTDVERITQMEQRLAALEAMLKPSSMSADDAAKILDDYYITRDARHAAAVARGEPIPDAEPNPIETLKLSDKFSIVWHYAEGRRAIYNKQTERDKERNPRKYWEMSAEGQKEKAEREEREKARRLREEQIRESEKEETRRKRALLQPWSQ